MRNYLKRLKLDFHFTESELSAAERPVSREGSIQDSDERWQNDAREILSDKTKRTYYKRVHFQHEAMKATVSCLGDPIAKDTHRWHLRLQEFAPPEPDLSLPD